MPNLRLLSLLALGLLALSSAYSNAAELSDGDRHFLDSYIHLHDALVAGDLPGAIKAAQSLSNYAALPAGDAKTLEAARQELSLLTPQAEKLVSGQPGYHTFYCPMAKKDWVQTKAEVENPYLGKDMLACGVEKK